MHFLTLTVVDWVDVFTRPVYKNIIIGRTETNGIIGAKPSAAVDRIGAEGHHECVVRTGPGQDIDLVGAEHHVAGRRRRGDLGALGQTGLG